MKKFKKIVSLLLAAVMFCTCFTALGITASAASKITYTVEQGSGVAYVSAKPANSSNYLVYTMDGTAPKEDGDILLYTVAVRVKTLFRIAEFNVYGEKVSGIKFTVTPKVENVNITCIPMTGGYTNVYFTCPTEGASIRYTTDGSVPDENSALYTEPIPVKTKTKFRVAAFKPGCKRSAVITQTVSLTKVERVTETARDVEDEDGVTVTKISSYVSYNAENHYTRVDIYPIYKTDTIYYTLDGSTPTKSSKKYNGKFIKITEPCTLRVVEYSKNGQKLATLKKDITLRCAPVEFTCTAIYFGTKQIELSTTTPGATIYYTINGLDPSTSAGIPYTSPIMGGDQTRLKAVAVKDEYKNSVVKSEKISEIPLTITAPKADSKAEDVAVLLNAEREKRGLAALKYDSRLADAAAVRAVEASLVFDHVRPTGKYYTSVFADKEITATQSSEVIMPKCKTPAEVVERIVSIADYGQLIDKSYSFNSIGVGIHEFNGSYYWVIIAAKVIA